VTSKLPLKDAERYDVTLLAFMDVIICRLLERAAPRTRRHNQLCAMHTKLTAVDETFVGYLPPEFQTEAEQVLGDIEQRLATLIAV
jgi:hypothetical protein